MLTGKQVADPGGLFLKVSSQGERGGTKTWRFKFRLDRKEKLLSAGRYREVTLEAARLARDEAGRALSEGRDPTLDTKRVKLVGRRSTGKTSRPRRASGTRRRSRAGRRCTPPT